MPKNVGAGIQNKAVVQICADCWSFLLCLIMHSKNINFFSITDLKIFQLSHMNMHIYNYSHSNVPKLPKRLVLCTHKMAMAHC
jgi:hypothetical protein